jgi:xanthine dehydrogenase accessory factor
MPNPVGPTPSSIINEAVKRVLRESSIAVLATLVEAARDVGAKLLVEESGARVGSLGDSALDEAVAQHARTFLATRAEATTFRIDEFARGLEQWSGSRVLFERIEPEPRLVICGAGHVGASLARLAHSIGYRTTLIDDRADFIARARFPEEGIELVAAENWTDAVRESIGRGHGVFVAVVTRGHNEDEECMRAVVASRPDYVGLIGSKRRTNIVLDRLREGGADEARLREVRAPIGLDIAAVSPQEVALAILAEIVAERRGGTGLSLSAWRRTGRD